MDIPSSTFSYYLYELQLQGIRCTGCAGWICKNLKGSFSVTDAKVNVLAEKLQITVTNPEFMNQIVDKIKSMDFKVLSDPREIKLDGKDVEKREIHFTFADILDIKPKLDKAFKERPGILKNELSKIYSKEHYLHLKVIYNPTVVKARWIYEQLLTLNLKDFDVYNPHLENFKSKSNLKKCTSFADLVMALITVSFFIIFALIIPNFSFFFEAIVYPMSFNVFSIYTIFMFVITILVMLKFGLHTFRSSIINFYKTQNLNMETLITLGSLASFIMAVFLIVGYGIENSSKAHLEDTMHMTSRDIDSERRSQILMIVEMLETTSLILAIITIGKYLEDKAKLHIVKMTDEIFPENTLLTNTKLEYIEPKNRDFMIESRKSYEISLLDRDDLIEITGPMKLLVDGVILHLDNENKQGIKVIDSACYGWDDAFFAQEGDRIKSGAEIIEGKAIIQIESVIENSLLCQMSKQLNIVQNNIETNENGISVLFSKLAANFVKIIIFLATLTLIVWLIIVGTESAKIDQFCRWCFPFERAISVLVASCPCALGLAIPSVIVITLNLAMKNSILIKKNTFFEKINRVKCVIFDKTGTLFTKVEEISEYKRMGCNDFDDEDLWQIISLLEKSSNHPLGLLLYKEAVKRIKSTTFNVNFVLLEKPTISKNGIIGNLKSKKNSDSQIKAYIGNITLNETLVLQDSIQKEILMHESLGQTALLFSIENELALVIYLDNSANLRPESKAVVHYLQNDLKKEVYILSGDSKETVVRIGEFLNIPFNRLFGNVDAQSKKALLKKLRETENKEVMMIGDGLNDVLSLQEAAVGVSINSKSELNIIASDVVALNENLWKIVSLFNLSKLTSVFIWLNLIWAFAYNICIIPIAAGALNDVGVMIPPFFSSLAMSGSSLVVVLFSNLLRFIRFDPTKRKNFKVSDGAELKDLKSRLIEEKKMMLKSKPSLEIDIAENARFAEIKWKKKMNDILPIGGEGELMRNEDINSTTTLRIDGNVCSNTETAVT